MTSRFSGHRTFIPKVIHVVISTADALRRFWLIVLVCLVTFAGAAVWMTTSAKANHWVWKGWERLFGPASINSVKPRILAQVGGSAGYTITPIDEPNAGTSADEGTIVFGVNASGAMTGTYSDQVYVGHGFVCAAGGTSCTSFDAPSAGSSPSTGSFQGTAGIGIDTAGDVVGIWFDSNNAYHGFFLQAGSTTPIDFDDPNETNPPTSRGTFPMGINDNGQIVGTYSTGSYDTLSLYHGFLCKLTGTTCTFTEIDDPSAGIGSVSSYQKEGTVPMAINASGVVAGFYVDSSGNRHGFIRSAAGSYASFDAPGATTNTGKGGSFTGTIPMSIDAAGDVVGSYTDSSGLRHGFILPAGSTTATPFNAPGANTTSQSGTFDGTFPSRIDATGSYITGIYTDSSGLGHGFVYYLPLTDSGSFTAFTAPNQITSTSGIPIQGGVLGVNASGTVVGFYLDSNEVSHGFEYAPTATPTPTFSPAQGTYSSVQSVTISDTDSSATIYYTTDGSTPTVSSTQYTGAITVSSTETINAVALDAISGGYIESAVASATYTINNTLPVAATPSFSPAAGTYASTQSVTISDATSGAAIYYTTDGTTPTTSSTVYSGPITVSSSETVEAMAIASGYANSAVATAVYTINASSNPTPVLSSLTPAFIGAGNGTINLTVTGTGFVSGSTVYWNSTALTTTNEGPNNLQAAVPASDLASSGTAAITVQSPTPGGGTSNTLEFEIQSGSLVNDPVFSTMTATVAPGQSANYPVTLPSSATDVTATCLNLPAGAGCVYQASSGAVTILTLPSTPAGTYQITVVFTETLPVSSALILLPFLLLPLSWARRRWKRQQIWITLCMGFVILAGAAAMGCGGGGSGGGGGGGSQTQTVTSSGVVTLAIQ